MIHLLVVLLLVARYVSTLPSINCPPAHDIYPCKCQPIKGVQCDDMTSIASVRATLEGHFTETIPRLVLKNVHALSLPRRALGDLKVNRFYLTDSSIRQIEKDAFDGQTSLGVLTLAYDRLEDIPTEALQHLPSLRTLSLSGNFLMRIEDQSLSNLNLRFLILYDNRISQLGRNAFPKNLEYLFMSRNLLSTFNGSLQSLEHLVEVYANDNRLTNIKGEFDGLVQLKHLHLDRNHISDISDSFSNLTSITSLSLSGNRIEDVGKSLMNLSQLKLLNLSYNYITELHWRVFEKLKSLEILDLSGNYLKTICLSLKPLRSLQSLKLSDLGLKSLKPDCFHNMKALETLDLSHNRLMNIDAISRNPLPALQYLYLNHNQLSTLKQETKYAKFLKELDISFNNFSSLKVHCLSFNKQLATLRMEGNPWKCSELTKLVLRDLEDRGVNLQGRPDC